MGVQGYCFTQPTKTLRAEINCVTKKTKQSTGKKSKQQNNK